MNKPTPYEIFDVARTLWKVQDCHPSNRVPVDAYIEPAIALLNTVATRLAGSSSSIRLHEHPRMQIRLKVPKDHVVIDRDVYEQLVQIHGEFHRLG